MNTALRKLLPGVVSKNIKENHITDHNKWVTHRVNSVVDLNPVTDVVTDVNLPV